MEMVLFVGIPATGKSSFYRERFFDSHIRINLDMLRTRHRQDALLRACLEARQPFVLDNTNVTRAERAGPIGLARSAGFRVIGYHFESRVGASLDRNRIRPGGSRVPDVAVRAKASRLEIPRMDEGFDALYYVKLLEPGGFIVEAWRQEGGGGP